MMWFRSNGRALFPSGAGHVAPLLTLMIFAFDIPIAMMLAISVAPDFTFANYGRLIETPVYLRVVGNTLWVAAITTAVCVIAGYPLAYWMYRLPARGLSVALSLIVMSFWVSVLVRTYAWIVALGNGGILNRALLALHLLGSPIRFLYSEPGVIIGMSNILIPYMVLPLFAAMVRVDERLLHAAASLGASDRTIFWRIFFPLTVPAACAGAILVFVSAAGFFVSPAILGGGRVPMLANLLDILINQNPRWELAAAISTVLLAASVACYALYRRHVHVVVDISKMPRVGETAGR